jgi:hypothetical protein
VNVAAMINIIANCDDMLKHFFEITSDCDFFLTSADFREEKREESGFMRD